MSKNLKVWSFRHSTFTLFISKVPVLISAWTFSNSSLQRRGSTPRNISSPFCKYVDVNVGNLLREGWRHAFCRPASSVSLYAILFTEKEQFTFRTKKSTLIKAFTPSVIVLAFSDVESFIWTNSDVDSACLTIRSFFFE